jgi:tetratricopeptide (TPR) repeat protein
MRKNLFILISKIAHELFELNYYDSSERLLEFTINEIDTCSLLLKMSTLSTLSACYWKQSKFSESIRCMNLEFNLVSHLNDLQNKYRILGNIANAYQLLSNYDEAKNYFKLQLSISLKMKNRVLTVHSLNSLGSLHLKSKEHEKALECFNKSLSLIQMLPSIPEPCQQQINKKRLLIKQYNLIGDCYLRLNQLQKARSYYQSQLEASNDIMGETEDENLLNICKSKLNLALIETKSSRYNESISIYEELLTKYFIKYKFNNFNLIEIYFKININLLNTCIRYNKIQKAVLYAQNLLEFSLNQQNKHKSKLLAPSTLDLTSKYYKYLKFIELCACSKLASCFSKLGNLTDSAKLYERELKIAKYLNNIIYTTRSYSHLAQIFFIKKDYNKCIEYYKDILNIIKSSVINGPANVDRNNDKKLLQMTYYTLSNLGLCMEIINRLNDAYLLFIEQYEISKRLNNLKYNANALLNIINLYFKYEKNFYLQTSFIDDYADVDTTLYLSDDQEQQQDNNKIIDNLNLKMYLYSLLDIYQELNDLNGELFISQCLAYYYHKNNFIKLAIKFYIHSVEICKILNSKLVENNNNFDNFKLYKKHNFYSNTNTLEKTLFNLSICYRYIRKYQEAYKYQIEYLYLVKMKNFKYSEFISLGIIADLLLEINANYDECIKIHISRLSLIQDNLRKFSENLKSHDFDRYNNELDYFTLKRCKLIANCLSSIAKCYFLFQDYQQVYKFKLMEFKLRIQDEQQMINQFDSTKNFEIIRKQYNKQKFKILLDLGNLLLFKLNNYSQALYYYEYAFKICKLNLSSDLILTSLALGNMGICKLKIGEYELAINFFKQQIQILNEKLENIIISEQDQKKYSLNMLDLKKLLIHKEYILVYLDIGRSYSKLSKCYENLNANSSTLNLFEDEALNYLIEYLNICELLFNKYCQNDNQTSISDKTDSDSDQCDINELVNDVNEQIRNDFDLSLYKLAKFYINKLKRQQNQDDALIELAVNLHERRLGLQLSSSKKDDVKIINKIIEINHLIANLYFKLKMFDKSYTYLVTIVTMVNKTFKNHGQDINRILYIQALVLYFKLSFKLAVQNVNMDFQEMLNYALDEHIYLSSTIDEKYIEIKFDLIDNIMKLYLKLNLAKIGVQFLRQIIAYYGQLKVNDRSFLVKILFKLNFKFAILQLNYELGDVSSVSSNNNDSVEIREQSINAAISSLFIAENYLNNDEFIMVKQIYELRLANLFYFKGIANKELKNFTISLEMFANALDLYENCFDKNVEYFEEVCDDELLEMPEGGLEGKIDMLYEYIEDLLIKTDKLREALLVTERHRSKFNKNLAKLTELSNFEQIETLLIEKNPLAMIYFHLIKFNSTINCWLLEPGLGITKFHQISFKSLSSLLLLVKNEDENFNFLKHVIQNDKDLLLKQAYSVLIKPFELNLFNWFHENDFKESENDELSEIKFKKKLVIIYDQDLFTIPFHLLKFETSVADIYLHEVFEISCLYSLKYLLNDKKVNSNFKFVQNESEFDKLVDGTGGNNNSNRMFYKLLIVNFISNPAGKYCTLMDFYIKKKKLSFLQT